MKFNKNQWFYNWLNHFCKCRFSLCKNRWLTIKTKQNKTISNGFGISKTKTITTVRLTNKQVFLSCFFFLVENFLDFHIFKIERGVV